MSLPSLHLLPHPLCLSRVFLGYHPGDLGGTAEPLSVASWWPCSAAWQIWLPEGHPCISALLSNHTHTHTGTHTHGLIWAIYARIHNSEDINKQYWQYAHSMITCMKVHAHAHSHEVKVQHIASSNDIQVLVEIRRCAFRRSEWLNALFGCKYTNAHGHNLKMFV